MITPKATYEELDQRVKELEKEASVRKTVGEQLRILSLVFEQDSNSIIILDREGKVEYANPKALDTYRIPSGKIKPHGHRLDIRVLRHSALNFSLQVAPTTS